MKKIIFGTIAAVLVAGAVALACTNTFCTADGNCPANCKPCCDKTACCETKK